MEATRNRNKILRSVIFTLIICTVLAIGISMNRPYASAEATDEFTFVGTSVRLDSEGNTSGIRFTYQFDQDLYDKLISNGAYRSSSSAFGMIIVPTSYIEEFESSGYTDYFTFFNDVKGKSKDQISTEFSIRQIVNTDDGSYQINGALVNMKYANYTRDFGSVAYYTTDGTSYFYQAYNAKKSIQGISIQAIELDQKTPMLTDKELDILYTYTDGYIPRVIYDASKDSHMSKLVNLPISADGSSSWQETREIETINGKDYFKIGAYELGESSAMAFSYMLDEGLDLSKYDFVTFDIIYNRGDIQIGLGNPQNINESAGGWGLTNENEPYTVTISRDFFLGMANMSGSWSLMAKDLLPGDTVYIGDFVAYNAKSIENILDTVPTKGCLSKENKDDIDTVEKVLSGLENNLSSSLKDYTSKISNYSRLLEAENLPMAAFDANESDDLLRFEPIAIPGEEVAWEGEISQVTYGGYRFFKFTVTKKGSSDCIVHSFSTEGMPLDDYDYMSYVFMTDGNNVEFGLGTPEQLEGMLSYLPPLTVQQIPATVNEIVEYSKNYCFVAKGLEVGESIYFGDYVSFNTDNIKYMVDNIPDADNITKYDRADVENAILLYDSLRTEEERLYVDPTGKLAACADKLRDMPYPLIQADKDLSESMFTPVESLLGMTLDKFEVTKEALYGDYWFKFTTTETNPSLDPRAYLAGLESIGLNKNIFDYDLLAFDIRLEEGSSFYDYGKEGETHGDGTIEIVVGAVKYNDGTITGGDNYLTIVPTGENTARAYLNLQDYAIYDNNTGELIGYDAESKDLVLGIAGAELGESVWIGDITAVSGDMLRTMIDKLPEADRITSADRTAFDEMYYYYELVHDYFKNIEGAWDQACEFIDPTGKVPACMEALSKQALKFYSTDDKYAYSTFKQEQFTVDDGDGYELECTVTDDGRYAFKVLKIGSTNTIGLSYSVEGLDFTGYEFVTFAVTTTGTGMNDETVKCNVISYAAGEVGDWEYLTPGEAKQIYINAGDFVKYCGSVLLGVSNLKVGDIIYLTPFSAYNPNAVRNELVSEIDKLPQYEGRGGEEDYSELASLVAIINDYYNDTADAALNNDDLLAIYKLLRFATLPEYALNASTDIDCVEQIDEVFGVAAGDFSISSVYDDGRSWLKITAGAGTTEEDAAFLKFNVDKLPGVEGDIIVFLLKSDGEVKSTGYSDGYSGRMGMIAPDGSISFINSPTGSDSVLVWMSPDVFAEATLNNIIAITGLNAGESMYMSSSLVINQDVFEYMADLLPESFGAHDEERATVELVTKIAELNYFDPLTQEQIIRINGTLVLPDIAIEASDRNNMDLISNLSGGFNGIGAANATVIQTVDGITGESYYKITAGDNVSDENPVMIRFQVLDRIGAPEDKLVVFKMKSNAAAKYNEYGEQYSAIVRSLPNSAVSLSEKSDPDYIPVDGEMIGVYEIELFYDMSLGYTAVFEGLAPGESIYISDSVTVSEQDVVNMVNFLDSLKIESEDETVIYRDVLKYCKEWIKHLQRYSFIVTDGEIKDKIDEYYSLLINSTVSNE